jgi:altronate dehydratase
MWMPWEPDAYKTGRVEYLEPELNKLMSEKMKNDKKAKEQFEQRLKETKQKAIEENIKKAQETGNKLSQNVDKDGNLYDVNVGLDEDMSSVADVAKEIFENDNVVPANTDHGAAAILAKVPEGFTSSLGNQETASATILNEENVIISHETDTTSNVDKLD